MRFKTKVVDKNGNPYYVRNTEVTGDSWGSNNSLYNALNSFEYSYDKYRNYSRNDDALQAALNYLVNTVLCNIGEYTHKDKKIQATVRNAYQKMQRYGGKEYSAYKTWKNILWNGLVNGYRLMEKVYTKYETGEFEGKIGYKKIKGIRYDNFTQLTGYNFDDKGNLKSIDVNGQTLTPDYYVHFSHQSEQNDDSIFGISRVHSSTFWCEHKKNLTNFMMMFFERYGQPGNVLSHSEYTDEEYMAGSGLGEKLFKAAQNFRGGSTLFLPPGMKFDYAENKGFGDQYMRAMDGFNKYILRGCLQPPLIFDIGRTGSYALGDVQFSAYLYTIKDVIRELVEEVLLYQVAWPIIKFNFGFNVDDIGSWEYNDVDKDPKSQKQLIEKLIEFQMNNEEMPIIALDGEDSNWWRRRLNIPDYKKFSVSYAKKKQPEPEKKGIDKENMEMRVSELENKLNNIANIEQRLEKIRGLNNFDIDRHSKNIKKTEMTIFDYMDLRKIEFELDKSEDSLKKLLSGLAENYLDQTKKFIQSKPAAADIFKFEVKSDKSTEKNIETWAENLFENGHNDLIDEAKRAANFNGAEFEISSKGRFEIEDIAIEMPYAKDDYAKKFVKNRSQLLLGEYNSSVKNLVHKNLVSYIEDDLNPEQAIQNLSTDLAQYADSKKIDVLTAKTEKIIPSRLDTVIRNNTTKIYNEARFNAGFNKEVFDIVEAFEFSAIIDSRTTNVCSEYDGRTFLKSDPIFWSIRPPLHHNCRSLLIARFTFDKFEISDYPTRNGELYLPNKGFEGNVVVKTEKIGKALLFNKFGKLSFFKKVPYSHEQITEIVKKFPADFPDEFQIYFNAQANKIGHMNEKTGSIKMYLYFDDNKTKGYNDLIEIKSVLNHELAHELDKQFGNNFSQKQQFKNIINSLRRTKKGALPKTYAESRMITHIFAGEDRYKQSLAEAVSFYIMDKDGLEKYSVTLFDYIKEVLNK